MHIVICGAGQVGVSIAEYLGDEYTVSLVDNDPAVLANASSKLDVQTVAGDATDPKILKRAGCEQASIFVAVTESENVNIVSCQMAHCLFKIGLKIARLRTTPQMDAELFTEYKKHFLPIDIIISPEKEITEEVIRRLKAPFASFVGVFMNKHLYLIGFRLEESCPFLGFSLKHLDKIFGPLETSVVKVVRQGNTFIPQAHDVLEKKDICYFLIPAVHLDAFIEATGHETSDSSRLLILGGGRTGLLLAESLEQNYPNISSILVEQKGTTTTQLVSKLQNTIILQGDVLDPYILEEAGVQFTDNVICVTEDDTTNILGSLLTRRQGTKHPITVVQRQSYIPLVQSLQIDSYINPSLLMISTILRNVRKNEVRTLHKLGDDALGTVMEIKLSSDSEAVGVKALTLNHMGEIWIVAVLKENTLITNPTDVILEAGNILLVLCEHHYTKRTRKLFEPNAES